MKKIIDKRIVLLLVMFFIVNVLLLNLYLRRTYGSYVLLDRCKTYNFVVKEIKEYKGTLMVNDSLKFATSYRNDSSVLMLDDFISEGDSISLNKNNDTLFLFRGNEKHWFIYYGEPCNE